MPFGKQPHQGAQSNQRQRIKTKINLQAQRRDYPARGRVPQACAYQHPYRLNEGNQAGTDKTDKRNGGSSGRLRQRGD